MFSFCGQKENPQLYTSVVVALFQPDTRLKPIHYSTLITFGNVMAILLVTGNMTC